MTLFEMGWQINLGENLVGVNYRGRWEIYWVDEDGIEMFSHFASPGESLQFYSLARMA